MVNSADTQYAVGKLKWNAMSACISATLSLKSKSDLSSQSSHIKMNLESNKNMGQGKAGKVCIAPKHAHKYHFTVTRSKLVAAPCFYKYNNNVE